MKTIWKYAQITILAMSAIVTSSVEAHLMVAQHGTLNIVDDGAYMVLSLPVGAFEGLDDNKDGEISMLEFNQHRVEIVKSVQQNIVLSDKQGKLPLQGIMLSPVMPHDEAGTSFAQLTVLGRFSLNDPTSELNFYVGLHSEKADEHSLEITASRGADNKKQVIEVTSETPSRMLFMGE